MTNPFESARGRAARTTSTGPAIECHSARRECVAAYVDRKTLRARSNAAGSVDQLITIMALPIFVPRRDEAQALNCLHVVVGSAIHVPEAPRIFCDHAGSGGTRQPEPVDENESPNSALLVHGNGPHADPRTHRMPNDVELIDAEGIGCAEDISRMVLPSIGAQTRLVVGEGWKWVEIAAYH